MAKKISLIVKCIVVVFIVVCAICKWYGVLGNASVGEICTVGGVIAAVFGDISLNTALDKFTQKKENDE